MVGVVNLSSLLEGYEAFPSLLNANGVVIPDREDLVGTGELLSRKPLVCGI